MPPKLLRGQKTTTMLCPSTLKVRVWSAHSNVIAPTPTEKTTTILRSSTLKVRASSSRSNVVAPTPIEKTTTILHPSTSKVRASLSCSNVVAPTSIEPESTPHLESVDGINAVPPPPLSSTLDTSSPLTNSQPSTIGIVG